MALFAEALNKARHSEEGLRILEEALALTHRNGERYYQAELFRLKGELILEQSTNRALGVRDQPDTTATAEVCFNESIKIAQLQKAQSLELRAVTSMARLYQNEGRQEEARRLLAQIYGRFSEGFDTADLRGAKALLDDLSQPSAYV